MAWLNAQVSRLGNSILLRDEKCPRDEVIIAAVRKDMTEWGAQHSELDGGTLDGKNMKVSNE